VLHYDNEAGLN